MPTLSLETIAALAGIPDFEIDTLHQFRQVLRDFGSDKENEQTRFLLESKIYSMEARFRNSVSLANWRSNNKAAEYIVIPNTNLGEPRLTNDARIIIKNIIRLAFKDGCYPYMLDDLKYEDLFLTNEFDVWAVDDWRCRPLEDEEKLKYVKYVKSIGIIIELFVRGRGDDIPKDVQLLINYLKEITSFDRFNKKVVVRHSSLLCNHRNLFCAENLYDHVIYNLQAAMPRVHPYNQPLINDFYNQVTDHFNPLSCGNLKDMDNWFMRQAYPNSEICNVHNLINSHSDENIANSVFGYLLVMKYGLFYSDDCEFEQLRKGQLNPTITKKKMDDWLYIMNPEYMSKLVQTFIENDILPGYCYS